MSCVIKIQAQPRIHKCLKEGIFIMAQKYSNIFTTNPENNIGREKLPWFAGQTVVLSNVRSSSSIKPIFISV